MCEMNIFKFAFYIITKKKGKVIGDKSLHLVNRKYNILFYLCNSPNVTVALEM